MSIHKLMPIFSGALAGTITALIISSMTPAPAPHVVYAPATAATAAAVSVPPEPAPPLEPAPVVFVDPEPEVVERVQPRAEEPRRPVPAPEEARALYTEQLAAALREHADEPTDPSWSADANRAIARDLDQVAEKIGFRTLSVDCRSTTCVSTLEWPDYAKAQQTQSRLVAGRYEVNCDRTLMILPPEDPSLPYRAELIFHCLDRQG